ncbi:MAG: CoA-acylating methylmalonate-semialdehyde dehydrogenase [Microbacteriaceae bacterium]|nr:CoA-acylating methylmalonate-semialdehyde dehydrogenase [Cryobacterium sp.]MCC6376874.1 CoA-acylating methylmalonate-semialdehyde dehydrogenase [Microbacteriaceae bacterium]
MNVADNFIAGKRVQSKSNDGHSVWNPATGEEIGRTPFSTATEVESAIAAAVKAGEDWGTSSLATRQQILFSIRQKLVDHTEELAQLITMENGKTIEDARMELRRGLEAIEFSCGIPHLLKGEHSSTVATGIDVHSILQPIGVVACITPFNFPVMVPLWMLANAIACGNTAVLKPSDKTPSSSVRMVELLFEAGLPAGVLNLVQGDKSAVDILLSHPDIAAVSFIGSTPVAKSVYETAAKNGKRVQALGGAKNHLVVLPDADMDAAASAAVASSFGAAGERCMAVSVLVAVGDAADKLIPKVAELAKGLNVGDGATGGRDLGPLVTGDHRDRVASYLDSGVEEGATIVLDGREDDLYRGPGFFLRPSIMDNVKPGMKAYKDEIFGPVLSVIRVENLGDALEMVNENPYGNGAVVFTESGANAREFQLKCNAGMVGVNVPIPTPVGWFSFGGWKSSLFGDLHMYGPDGVRFFTRQKVVTSRWFQKTEGTDKVFPFHMGVTA